MEGNQMRVLILVAALLLIVPTGAAAAPWTVGLLNTYLVGGFSCEVDDKSFSNFAYSASAVGTTPVPATGITVTPIMTPDPGLQFSAAWAAGSGQSQDSLVDFTAASLEGATIVDNTLSFVGVFSGTGLAGVDDVACLGGALPCVGGTIVGKNVVTSSA
jgi:hypothetical protein